MTVYGEDQMLMLSGIQHYVYCPRQWALIHIEQEWRENSLTLEGALMHERVDNPTYHGSSTKDCFVRRSVHVASSLLGLTGICDIVEFTKSVDDGIAITGRSGLWTLYPVEYKRGKPKHDECDEMQLAAQVICLEEIYGQRIDTAYIYYGEIRHRVGVEISDTLRRKTIEAAREMHNLYDAGILPKAENTWKCRRCSLADICMPQVDSANSVREYLNKYLLRAE